MSSVSIGIRFVVFESFLCLKGLCRGSVFLCIWLSPGSQW